jgi:hypothetical protein
MRKMTMLVSGGVGYVLGARAGRERYEQIRSMALKVKGNPTVQATASKAADAAKEAAPVVKDKVSDAAGAAKEKLSGSDDSSTNGTPLTQTGYPATDPAAGRS